VIFTSYSVFNINNSLCSSEYLTRPLSFHGGLRPPRFKGCTDVTAELQKLADLRKSGALTDEEFVGMKKKLLGL
jgi:hypothetical protein